MKLVKCEECERAIDCDEDPECFVDKIVGNHIGWKVLCWDCRNEPLDKLLTYLTDTHECQ